MTCSLVYHCAAEAYYQLNESSTNNKRIYSSPKEHHREIYSLSVSLKATTLYHLFNSASAIKSKSSLRCSISTRSKATQGFIVSFCSYLFVYFKPQQIVKVIFFICDSFQSTSIQYIFIAPIYNNLISKRFTRQTDPNHIQKHAI